MEELLDIFKADLEEMMDEWYKTLDHLMDGALFNLSFVGGDFDEHCNMIQDVMMEVLQERLAGIFDEDGSLTDSLFFRVNNMVYYERIIKGGFNYEKALL